MSSRKRHRIEGYAGVFYIEVQRANKKEIEKTYYIRYRKKGKLIEEKVGKQYQDNMTPEKAADIRCLRIEGRLPTNQEQREQIKKAKERQPKIYSFSQIFSLFEEAKKDNKSLKDDKSRYALYIAPVLGNKNISQLTLNHIEKIQKDMLKSGKSAQTIKHVFILLKRLINYAAKIGLVENVLSVALYFETSANIAEETD